jgi:hypothetical protein
MFDQKQNEILRGIKKELAELVAIARYSIFPKSLVLNYTVNLSSPGLIISPDPKGEKTMGATVQPLALLVGQKASAVVQEFSGLNGSGDLLPAVGPLVFAADPSGAITVDPVTGEAVGVNPTADGAVATSTVTDQGDNLVGTFTFTVTPAAPPPPVPQSLVLNYTLETSAAAAKHAEAAGKVGNVGAAGDIGSNKR